MNPSLPRCWKLAALVCCVAILVFATRVGQLRIGRWSPESSTEAICAEASMARALGPKRGEPADVTGAAPRFTSAVASSSVELLGAEWRLATALGATFLTALLAALVLTAVVRVVAPRLGILDYPDGKRKLHRRPVALCGGVAVYLGFLAGIVMWVRGTFGTHPAFLDLGRIVAATGGAVCLFGVLDDCRHLHSRTKLALQLVAVAPIVALGYWFDRIVVFGVLVELGWLGVPLTLLWLVGCVNALNLLDGMDGLASTIGMITALMMSVIAMRLGNPHVACVAVALAGALAGFLFHNLPPARVFLGDSGSTVIGVILGVLAIQGPMKSSTTVAITVPLVVMSLPILDTTLAIVRRKLTGRSFASADRQHIHHRLLDRGLGPWQALGLLSGVCALTGMAATASVIFGHDVLAWSALLLVVVVAVRFRWFAHPELAMCLDTGAKWLIRLAGWMTGISQRLAHQPTRLVSPFAHRASGDTATSTTGAAIKPAEHLAGSGNGNGGGPAPLQDGDASNRGRRRRLRIRTPHG